MAVAPGIFRQYDIRGLVGRDLTTEAARAIGGAYAAYRRARGGANQRIGTIAVGRDNRPSGGSVPASSCVTRSAAPTWSTSVSFLRR